MARTPIHPLFLMFLPFGSSAQIILENEIPVALHSFTTLLAGTKLMPLITNADSCVIYNVDFTPYRTLHMPALPEELNWYGPNYITESLFDTDQSTIEYLMIGEGEDGNAAVVIGREDGSLLLNADGRLMQVLAGGLAYGPGIFATANGTKMILRPSFADATRIYSLPGSLPCVASCQPAATNYITGGVSEGMLPENGQRAFPNPTSERITIPYALPPEETQAILLLRDAAGRVVLERRLNGSGTYELETGQLPNGVYPYTIMGANGVLTSSRIVVMR